MTARCLTLLLCLYDYDVVASIKEWTQHSDKILSLLCDGLVNRKIVPH
jgi:hypothetical protein